MEFNPEVKLKCLYLELQRKNDELDEKLASCGFDKTEDLLNVAEGLPCIEVLRKWGVTNVSEPECLLAFSKYEMEKAQSALSNLSLQSQKKLTNNKIGVVKKLKKELDNNNIVVKREMEKRSYQMYREKPDEKSRNNMVRIPLTMEARGQFLKADDVHLLKEKLELEKKKRLERLREEVEQLREEKKKYLDLPPDLEGARAKLEDAKLRQEAQIKAFIENLY